MSHQPAKVYAPVQLPDCVYPSTRPTITALPTDDVNNGAHNYWVDPMIYFDPSLGKPVYAAEPEAAIEIRFVKKREDGTWQAGLLTEQLLLLLRHRHTQLQAGPFPAEQAHYDQFQAGITMALDALGLRFKERETRGVAGDLKK